MPPAGGRRTVPARARSSASAPTSQTRNQIRVIEHLPTLSRLRQNLEVRERTFERLLVRPLVFCHLGETLGDFDLAGRSRLVGELRVLPLDLEVLVLNRRTEVVCIASHEPCELGKFREVLLQLDGGDPFEDRGEVLFSPPARCRGEHHVARVCKGLASQCGGEVLVRLRVHRCPPISPVSIVAVPAPAGIRKTAERDTSVSTDAPRLRRVQPDGVTSRDTNRAELDTLRSEWREALLATRKALQAVEGVLPPDELDAHQRRLRDDYRTAAVELRQFALDEGLPTELAEPFLPHGLARRALGLPATVRSCVFELDDVLVGSVRLHQEAWGRTLNELLAARSYMTYGHLIAPFDPRTDYPEYIAGRPRLEGVRTFLASRGIRLPEGTPDDPAGAETVHGLANRKNEWMGRLLEQHGVDAFDGVRHYLELAKDAGLGCGVVSASAHTEEMLRLSGLAELVDRSVDAETIATERLRNRPAPDRLLAACRQLRAKPEQAAAFVTSRAGVAAARAAGFAWIVAVDPTGDPANLRQFRRAGADIAVRGLADLLEHAD